LKAAVSNPSPTVQKEWAKEVKVLAGSEFTLNAVLKKSD
jgi:hypothetical protein